MRTKIARLQYQPRRLQQITYEQYRELPHSIAKEHNEVA